jgi:hypothetical protein
MILVIPAMAASMLCGNLATIEENSGAGPNYTVRICDGDDRYLIVDGSPLQNGAIILGFGPERWTPPDRAR